MKIAILGGGIEGRSAASHYLRLGHQVVICDRSRQLTDLPPGCQTRLGQDYLKNLSQFDLLIRSPSLPPQAIVDANPEYPDILQKITSASNEFFKLFGSKTIAITGTKGKGTTSLLCQAILEAAGLEVCLAGNIGIAPFGAFDKAASSDAIVFEISSFQALDLKFSPAVGVCLNISRDHLDWHPDYDDYLKSKAQLFAHQTKNDQAIYAAGDDDSHQIVANSQARTFDYNGRGLKAWSMVDGGQLVVDNQTIGKVGDIKLPGTHNRDNVCAALAACYSRLPENNRQAVVAKALSVITSLPCRIETIDCFDGVSYIDDSAATTPEASIAALESVKGGKILIAGGHDKGADMKAFAAAIINNDVRHLIAIGETGQTIARLVKEIDPGFSIDQNQKSMATIVAQATAKAKPGQTVLLSAGSASFGLFKNKTDRSNQFRKAVAELQTQPVQWLKAP